MIFMNADLPPITATELERSGWEKAIEGASGKEAHELDLGT